VFALLKSFFLNKYKENLISYFTRSYRNQLWTAYLQLHRWFWDKSIKSFQRWIIWATYVADSWKLPINRHW